jgi:hypothetical protein
MNLYVYQQGYIRTSSSPYLLNKDNLKDLFIHLTNNAIQKENTTYNAYEEANQLSYQSFDDILQKEYNCPPSYF